MTRIIGGKAGGRRIAVPRGAATRPTSDRVREALFSAIESWCGSLSGLRFLDLYAGSGAVGLEAWSRGAGVVSLVEHDRRTAAMIEANATSLGFHKPDVRNAPVAGTLHRHPSAPYDVAFLDPPYPLAEGMLLADLEALVAHEWLVPGALVVVERSARGSALAWPTGYTALKERSYGDSMLWYGHATADAPRRSADPHDTASDPD
jgi:16S rRNA (guanine966-N2)-methyltransferase